MGTSRTKDVACHVSDRSLATRAAPDGMGALAAREQVLAMTRDYV